MNLIHKTRFSLPDKQLVFGRAYLYEDHVELKGWTWKGRYSKNIALDNVRRVKWWAQGEGANFAFFFNDDTTFGLRLKSAAGTWKFEIDTLLGSSSFKEATLPGEASKKDAAA